jgi:DNA-binding beta-propeller fold protein YncE
LYISALNAAGSPALFTASVSGGSATEVFSGSPLVDPLALDASPDDSALYVVDSLASDGLGAVFVFETAGWSYQETLAWGFNVAFPGGVAADDSGTSVLYTSMSDAALTLLMTDGSGFEVIDTGALLYLPAGVSIYGETAYVAELSSEASSDLYLLTF